MSLRKGIDLSRAKIETCHIKNIIVLGRITCGAMIAIASTLLYFYNFNKFKQFYVNVT